MINCRIKGRRNENRCKKMLEDDGWKCIQAEGSQKFKKQVDIFGCFDLYCVKWDINTMKTINCGVQVKTNKRPDKYLRKQLQDFKNEYPDVIVAECIFYDRVDKPKIIYYNKTINIKT